MDTFGIPPEAVKPEPPKPEPPKPEPPKPEPAKPEPQKAAVTPPVKKPDIAMKEKPDLEAQKKKEQEKIKEQERLKELEKQKELEKKKEFGQKVIGRKELACFRLIKTGHHTGVAGCMNNLPIQPPHRQRLVQAKRDNTLSGHRVRLLDDVGHIADD